jgi:hypothetical protein
MGRLNPSDNNAIVAAVAPTAEVIDTAIGGFSANARKRVLVVVEGNIAVNTTAEDLPGKTADADSQIEVFDGTIWLPLIALVAHADQDETDDDSALGPFQLWVFDVDDVDIDIRIRANASTTGFPSTASASGIVSDWWIQGSRRAASLMPL